MKPVLYKTAMLSLLMFLSAFIHAEEVAKDTKQSAVPTTQQLIRVDMKTSEGNIILELDNEKAPLSVANFLSYVDSGFYNGTIFHRVIAKFMIQGGGFNALMQKKETQLPIKNEATNGLKNVIGSIAMARTNVVDSATSQFFINLANNAFLDNTSSSFGYAVFGRVIAGMDVVRAIESVKTSSKPPLNDVPVKTVTILSMQRIN